MCTVKRCAGSVVMFLDDISNFIFTSKHFNFRSRWSYGLRHMSAAARLLGLRVRIPPRAWMYDCCECCELSRRGICDELITRLEESCRLWCVVVCDLEPSWMRKPWPSGGAVSPNKKLLITLKYCFINPTFVASMHEVDKEMWLLLSSHKNTFDLDVTCPRSKSDCWSYIVHSVYYSAVPTISTKNAQNCQLTLNLLTTTIVAPPSNASKWQMGFNSAFKGLIHEKYF
jgi:hypothetical protein